MDEKKEERRKRKEKREMKNEQGKDKSQEFFLNPCLKILLRHSNSSVLRVTITRKAVAYAPERRAERL